MFYNLLDDTDYEFLCSILEDIDISDDWHLWMSNDELVLWLVREINERCYYPEDYEIGDEMSLQELIAQARQEGKWLHCSYQDMWFSPDELEKENSNGKFRWDSSNFQLRNPDEELLLLSAKIRTAQKNYHDFANRMG